MPRHKKTTKVYSLRHGNDRPRIRYNEDDDFNDELSLDVAKKKKGADYGSKSKKSSNKKIVIDDDAPNILNPTASKELILDLVCCEDQLNPEQEEFYKKEEKEYKEVIKKFEKLAKENGGDVVHKGNIVAYQYNTTAVPTATVHAQPNGTPEPFTGQTAPLQGFWVGTMTPTNAPVASPAGITRNMNSPATPTAIRPVRAKRRGKTTPTVTPTHNVPPPIQPQPSTSNTTPIRPAESTAVGGLSTGNTEKPAPAATASAIVDLTSDDGKPAPDSREVAFNKLQGKTYPSLVVVARPHLHAKEASTMNDRSVLDAKVKHVLVYSPTKFTEWLIQQGLVRSEQQCVVHPQNKLNLGMYSDVAKFPYSGGYVWISECCPQKFVSVFNGSLFESSSHPPNVILKLIYHWACQTNIQNVVQWVKVDNLYVKGVYTWLRACCTISLQKTLKLMGGPNKKIEVGVISLGTTSQDGSQRQVKVEVLGVLDSEAKLIRLRAVEPLADGERNYRRRFSKILEPLKQWAHPESIITTDLTVDKGTLQMLGFNNIMQNTQSGQSGNQAVMEYLRRIVPRMFQNTLSLLSRQIIQQFLDELVWREWYGQTPNQAFTNMATHLAEQTRLNTGDTIIQRLNKVAAYPFKNHWTMHFATTNKPQTTPIENLGAKRYNRKRPATNTQGIPIIEIDKPPAKKQALSFQPAEQENISTDVMVPLEGYYYGSQNGDNKNPLAQKVVLNVRCCVCKVPYTNNIELLDHLLAHAHNISAKAAMTQCRYCLISLPKIEDLSKHIGEVHPVETKSTSKSLLTCVICEVKFNTVYLLGKHMSKEHVPQEMPYQCGTCGYRSSSHRLVVDHFYKEHDGATTLQCPFCLKSTTVWSAGRVLTTNVTFFLAHLQKHQRKSMAKKCSKCALWFIHKEILKDHQTKAHVSFSGKKNVVPFSLPTNFFTVPKSKLVATKTLQQPAPRPVTPEPVQHNIVLDIPVGMTCKECSKDMDNSDHFPQKLHCGSCRYVTDCTFSLNIHKSKCNIQAMPRVQLDSDLHCVCGYSSRDGNQVAKHLALCERKTAYPTAEQAQAVTDTHSMLDVLGLVRRNDDSNQVESTPTVKETVEEDKDKPEEQPEKEPEEPQPDVVPSSETTENTEAVEVTESTDTTETADITEAAETVEAIANKESETADNAETVEVAETMDTDEVSIVEETNIEASLEPKIEITETKVQPME